MPYCALIYILNPVFNFSYSLNNIYVPFYVFVVAIPQNKTWYHGVENIVDAKLSFTCSTSNTFFHTFYVLLIISIFFFQFSSVNYTTIFIGSFTGVFLSSFFFSIKLMKLGQRLQ